MSIYRRKSGRWAVLIDVDAPAGKARARKTLGTFATRKEAERAERAALSARDRGIDLSPTNVTVDALLTRYLSDRRSRCAVKTMQEYDRIVERNVRPYLGAHHLAKLRPAHVAEWQATLAAGTTRGALSQKSVYHARALLVGAMRWAVRMQLLGTNPCDAVEPPHVRRSEAKALAADEVQRILFEANSTRWAAFVTLALAIGARRGELLALRWPDIDTERRVLMIRGSLTQTTGNVSLKGTKTDRVRSVPLSRIALDALGKQRTQQAADRLRAGGHYGDEGWVFADEIGRRISPMSATNAYARLARKAKISSTRLHDARHTAATRMLTGGADVRTVSGVLGHSSAVVTLGTYAHLLVESTRAAIDALGDGLEAVAGEVPQIARQPNGNRGRFGK